MEDTVNATAEAAEINNFPRVIPERYYLCCDVAIKKPFLSRRAGRGITLIV